MVASCLLRRLLVVSEMALSLSLDSIAESCLLGVDGGSSCRLLYDELGL